MRRWWLGIWWLASVSGCGLLGDSGNNAAQANQDVEDLSMAGPDLAVAGPDLTAAGPDLAPSSDLATSADLTVPEEWPDLAEQPDLAADVTDLVMPPGDAANDLAVPGDLAKGPDLKAPADLAVKPDLAQLSVTPGAGPLSAPERLQQLSSDIYLLDSKGLAVGDLDGDGADDIVSIHNNEMASLLSDGSGRFRAPIFKDFKWTPMVLSTTKCCKLVDSNNDGHLDVIFTFNNNTQSNTLLGRGDGTFDNTWAPVGGDQVGGPNGWRRDAVGDFDGDGQMDNATVVPMFNEDAVRVSLGLGGGMFQSTDPNPVCRDVAFLAAGDFNRDGVSDLAAQGGDQFGINVLLGRRAGPLLAQVDQLSPDVGNLGQKWARPGGTRPRKGDFDGNRWEDLIVVWYKANQVGLFLSKGDGTFDKRTLMAGNGPIDAAVSDLNGDGKLDVAVANYGGNDVSVLLGNGDGTFAALRSLATAPGPLSVASADFDGDNKLDLAVMTQNSASVFPGNGDGTFRQSINAGGVGLGLLLTGDVNGDGKVDLLCAGGWADQGLAPQSLVLLGKGDGTFKGAPMLGAFDESAAIGDLDGDGADDLVTTTRPQRWDYPYSGLEVRISKRDGTFAAPVSYFARSMDRTATMADIDGDGKLDVAVITSYYAVAVLRGNGDGTLQPMRLFANPYGTAVTPDRIIAADVDGNGRSDLVLSEVLTGNGITGQQVAVFRNTGRW